MRLAEFKTRLFIFFAGRLLQWAESIEREITHGQSPTATLVDDGKVLFAESAQGREAPPGPPEHWARLVASSPPQHWLDLIRDKAPQLLPPSESLLPSAQAGVESFGQDGFKAEDYQQVNSPPAGEDGAVHRSKPQALFPENLSRKKSDREANYSAAKARRSTWLNRLRFHAPGRRADSSNAGSDLNIRTRDSDSLPAAGGAAEQVSESIQQSTATTAAAAERSAAPGASKTIPARLTIARSAGNHSPDNRSQYSAPHKRSTAPQNIPRLAGNLSSRPGLGKNIEALPTTEAKLNESRGTEEAWTEHDPYSQAGAEYVEPPCDRPEPARWESFSVDPIRQSQLQPTTPEPADARLQINRYNPLLNSAAKNATSTPAHMKGKSIRDHRVDNPSGKRATPLNETDLVRSANSQRPAAANSSNGLFRQRSMNESNFESERAQSARVEETTRTPQIDNHRAVLRERNHSAVPSSTTPVSQRPRFSNQSGSPARAVVDFVSSPEQAGKEFAQVEQADRNASQWRTIANENVWPVLPPPPKFDVADELAAKEQEAEGIRRLDHEQRGIFWNA